MNKWIGGIGALFFGKDEATKVIKKVETSLKEVNEAAKEVGKSGKAGIKRFSDQLGQLNSLSLSTITGALGDLGNMASSGLQVSSTGLESFGAQFGQTYRQMTAGLGPFRGEVDRVRGQISGLSHSLGIGAEGMITYAANISRAGHTVDEFGLSMRAVAGLEQAGIIQGAELSAMLTDLSNSYGLGADGAMALTDEMVALGTSFGQGQLALRSLPNIMAAISPVGAELRWTGAQASAAARSITELAMAQTSLGGDPQQAMEGAIGVFTQLAGARVGMRQLFAGMGNGFPELAQSVGLATNNIDDAISGIMSNPAEFAQQMMDLYDRTTDPTMRQRITSTLAQFGDGLNWLVLGGEDTRAALAAARQEIADTAGATQRMGESGAGSTRTFAESMELLGERFQTTLNTMVHGMPGYRGFERNVLRSQARAFQNLSGRIEDFTSGSGPLNALSRVAMATHRAGISGLAEGLRIELGGAFPALADRINDIFPILGELSDGLLESARDVAPMATALGSLGLRLPSFGAAFGLLLNPITLLAAGLVYLALRGDQLESDLSRLDKTVTNFAGKLVKLSGRLLGFVKDINWDKFGRNIVEGILGAFGMLEGGPESEAAQSMSRFFRNVFDAASIVVRGLAGGLWDRTIEWITEPEGLTSRIERGAMALGAVVGLALVSPLGGAILTSLTTLGPAIVTWLAGLPALLSGISGAIGMAGGIGAIAGPMAMSLLRALPGIGAVIGVLVDLPDILTAFDTGGIADGFLTLFSSIANGALLGIPRLIERFTGVDLIGQAMGVLFEFSGFGRVLELIDEGYWASAITETLFNIFNGAFAGIPNIIRAAIERVTGEDIFLQFTDPIATALEQAVAWVTGGEGLSFLMSIVDRVREGFDTISNGFMQFWAIAGPIVSYIVDSWSDFFSMLAGDGASAIGGFADRLRSIWDSIIEPVVSLATDYFSTMFDVVTVAGRWLMSNVFIPLGIFIGGTLLVFFAAWSKSIQFLGSVFMWLWRNVLSPVSDFISDVLIDRIGSMVSIWVGVFRTIGAVISWWWTNVAAPVLGLLWDGFQLVVRGLGEIFMALWDDVLQPVGQWFSELWEGISADFGGFWDAVSEDAGRVWNEISQNVMVLWNDYMQPWADWVLEIWEDIKTAGISIWHEISRAVADRLNSAGQAIDMLKNNWELAKNVMSAGFRLVGAEINEWLLSPFLDVSDAVTNLGAGMRIAFLDIKRSIFEVFKSIFMGFADMMERLLPGGVGTSLAAGLRTFTADTFDTSGITAERQTAVRERDVRVARNEARRVAASVSVAVARGQYETETANLVRGDQARRAAAPEPVESVVAGPTGRGRGRARRGDPTVPNVAPSFLMSIVDRFRGASRGPGAPVPTARTGPAVATTPVHSPRPNRNAPAPAAGAGGGSGGGGAPGQAQANQQRSVEISSFSGTAAGQLANAMNVIVNIPMPPTRSE